MENGRIVNVIRHPHLVTFRPSEDSEHRSCAVADYKVFFVNGDGILFVSSVLDEHSLTEFRLEDAERYELGGKDDGGWLYPWCGVVRKADVDDFLYGEAETYSEPLDAMCSVLSYLHEAGCKLSDDCVETLRRLRSVLDVLIASDETDGRKEI